MGAAAANELQRVAVEESAHGIPLLIGLDVIHGHRTIFPIPLAQACSFDADVAESDGRVSGREATSGGVNWAYSPMVDVSRDARWGRVCEGFGEDALVGSVFGAAKVRGFQGESLSDPDSLAACAKHFVAYGAAEAGRDYNAVDISERRLHDVYLRPFHAVVDAGVASVMASFNTISGLPVHANRHLLTEVLKDAWGFEGLVVGDADGVRNLVPHGVAETHAHARRIAFDAGLDVEMGISARPRRAPRRPRGPRRSPPGRCRTTGADPQARPRSLRDALRGCRRGDHRASGRASRGRPGRGRTVGRAAHQRRDPAARSATPGAAHRPVRDQRRPPRRVGAAHRRPRGHARRRVGRRHCRTPRSWCGRAPRSSGTSRTTGPTP